MWSRKQESLYLVLFLEELEMFGHLVALLNLGALLLRHLRVTA